MEKHLSAISPAAGTGGAYAHLTVLLVTYSKAQGQY